MNLMPFFPGMVRPHVTRKQWRETCAASALRAVLARKHRRTSAESTGHIFPVLNGPSAMCRSTISHVLLAVLK